MAYTITKVQDALSKIEKDAIIFVDVDNTLIIRRK